MQAYKVFGKNAKTEALNSITVFGFPYAQKPVSAHAIHVCLPVDTLVVFRTTPQCYLISGPYAPGLCARTPKATTPVDLSDLRHSLSDYRQPVSNMRQMLPCVRDAKREHGGVDFSSHRNPGRGRVGALYTPAHYRARCTHAYARLLSRASRLDVVYPPCLRRMRGYVTRDIVRSPACTYLHTKIRAHTRAC